MEKDELREWAARYRRMAATMEDAKAVAALMELAITHEAIAAKEESWTPPNAWNP